MPALPPDNHGTADRVAGDEVATGDELFEPGETRMITAANWHEEDVPCLRRPSSGSESRNSGWG